MQNLDWNAVRDFLAVARRGTLNAAAANLGVNASTVGRRVEALEATLGRRLFQRAQTGYTLTDEGADLLIRAEAVEAAAYAFELRAQGRGEVSVGGRVRLATAENLANFALIPHLAGLIQRHPALTVEIVTDIRSANLHRREADLALRLVRPLQGNVSIRRVGTQRHGLYGSASYVAARAQETDAARFDDDRFIAWTEPYHDLPSAQWVDRTLAGRAPALVLSSLYGQVMAARQGLGLAVLPRFLAEGDSDLVHVASEVDGIEEPLWLAIHSDLAGSARVRAVATMVEEAVAGSALR